MVPSSAPILFAVVVGWFDPPGEARQYEALVGIRVSGTANHKPCSGATVIPIEWPEQRVELVEETIKNCRARIRKVGSAGAMLLIAVGPLRAGEEASALYRYRITVTTRHEDWSGDRFPDEQPRPERSLRAFLAAGPGIESRDRAVRKLANELSKDLPTDWEAVLAFRDWALREVKYQEQDFTSAKAALTERVGDCEEKSALFIALCRARGIPARTVWSPGHAWAEVHLVDRAGVGHWITVDASHPVPIGVSGKLGVILQKGDNLRLPERKGKRTRLLNDWHRGYRPAPTVEFIQRITPAPTEPPSR